MFWDYWANEYKVGDYECGCPQGKTGDTCQENVDECAQAPCKNNGTCSPSTNGYRLVLFYVLCWYAVIGLVTLFKSFRNLIKYDLNYSCTCPEGLRGQNCEEDIDECENENNEICNNGICVNNFGGFQCFCRPGFTGDFCDLNFDECLWDHCQNGATCEDKENAYKCHCVPGYEGKLFNLILNISV